MSERMIELQRAKLGLPPAGQSPSVQNSAGSPKASPHTPAAKQQTPEEAAVASMHTEDSQMERFINRLQRRDDSNAGSFGSGGGVDAAGGSHGPTVPTALSRRMLHRQGVGYLDTTVASMVSASADRFLATILQQSIACRDQRLKGAAMAREAAKHRKRHMQHYKADTDDRKRRKELIHEAREAVAQNTINKAEVLKRGGAAKAASDEQNAKKKVKKKDDGPANGTKLDPSMKRLAEEEEDEYDSIDEEEEFYQENAGEVAGERSTAGDDEEEYEDDTLLLRDIVRPLEAWNFHLTGKETLESDGEEFDDEEEANDDVDGSKGDMSESEEIGNDGTLLANGTDGNKSEGNKDDDRENDGKKSTSSVATPAAPS